MDRVFREIMRVIDPSSLTESEKAHVPVIDVPGVVPAGEMFPVTVKVGKVPHAVESAHYVQFVDLFADQTFLARVTFTPTAPKPKTVHFLVLNESATLRAVAFCNLHGFWESARWVSVE